jgi:hypothetical protein
MTKHDHLERQELIEKLERTERLVRALADYGRAVSQGRLRTRATAAQTVWLAFVGRPWGSAMGMVNELCVVCGMTTAGARTWVASAGAEGPRLVHEHCRNWSREPFPFATHLDALTRLLRQGRIPAANIRAVEGHVRSLAALRRQWPTEAPDVLEDGRAIKAAVFPLLGDVDPKIRTLF